MDERISKIEQSIQNLKNKNSRIYFFVQDTKGNARASVRYIYQMAMSLKESGYNSIILHEKPDYTGVASWLGEDYMTKLPHRSIEGQNLEMSPEDFIVVPEIYGFIMEQIKDLPCGKIVLAQSYAYVLETLQPGQSWATFGFLKCITTTKDQMDYIDSYMKRIYKTVLALAASLFITKTEAKISEVNNRVVRIRFALIQQVESKQNDKAENLITYLQAKHDLDSSINSSVAC